MAERGELIKPKEWFKRCKSFDVAGVFEALAKHDCKATDDMIWGDKSPGYIRHTPLLKNYFHQLKLFILFEMLEIIVFLLIKLGGRIY